MYKFPTNLHDRRGSARLGSGWAPKAHHMMGRAALRHSNDIVNDHLAQWYKRACIGQPLRRPSVRRVISESWKDVKENVVIEHIPNSLTQKKNSFWIFELSQLNSDFFWPEISHWQFGAHFPLSPVTEWLSWVFPTQERMKERKSSRAGLTPIWDASKHAEFLYPSKHPWELISFRKRFGAKLELSLDWHMYMYMYIYRYIHIYV